MLLYMSSSKEQLTESISKTMTLSDIQKEPNAAVVVSE